MAIYNLIRICLYCGFLGETSNTKKRQSRHFQLAEASLIIFINCEVGSMQLTLHKSLLVYVIADFWSHAIVLDQRLRKCTCGFLCHLRRLHEYLMQGFLFIYQMYEFWPTIRNSIYTIK